MDVFHVVFDTSVLRKEHFQHALFEKLLGLSRRGLVKIYIPHVVLEELRTQWIATVFNAIDAINSNLELLRSSSSHMHLEGLSQPVAEIWTKEEVERNSRSAFERFVAKNKIERLHMTLEQAEGMWNRYFSCLPPFDSSQKDRTKRRVDIPDAWILESALGIRERKGRHCVLVEDAKLKAAFEAEGFEIFPSISDLISTVEAANVLVQLGPEEGESGAFALKALQESLAGMETIVIGINEAMGAPPKERLFTNLEKAGVDGAIARREAKALVDAGELIDTGDHFVPKDRALAKAASKAPLVAKLMLRLLEL